MFVNIESELIIIEFHIHFFIALISVSLVLVSYVLV